MTGYYHPDYARSLQEFGNPLLLSKSEGWLLQRPIANSHYSDAMGCYPLFTCRTWPRLEEDLDDLSGKLVSVVLVADPFGNHDDEILRCCFPDRLIRFKEHFVVDLTKPWQSRVSNNHRRNIDFAVKSLEIERISNPVYALEEWDQLYELLIRRHMITGVSAFSKASFSIQFSIPGLIAFKASYKSDLVGMALWYISGDTAYYHLAAYTEKGYDLKTSFGIFWESFHYLSKSGCRWVNLGAGSGIIQNQEDGLTRFKKGWATDSRPAYLCGRILDREKYGSLVNQIGHDQEMFFPAYRKSAQDL